MKQKPPQRRVLMAELERRSVFRVSAVYGSAAFVLLEAIRFWAPDLGFPSLVVELAAVIAVLGYPVALYLAWHYEVSGEGVDRTDDASSGEIRERTGKPRARRWAPSLLGVIGILLLTGAAFQILFA
jgi:hypothetical protein